MFKQVKSFFFWSMLYKFRKRLTLVAILLSIVLLSQWIYSDIVEYLTLTKQTNYLNYVLPIKWIVVFFNIALSVYLILNIFKVEKQQNTNKNKKKDTQKYTNKEELITPKITDREKEFMTKKLRTEAEIIMDK